MRVCRSCSALLFLLAAMVRGQTPQRRDSVVVTGSFQPIPLEEAERAVRVLDVRDLELVSNSFPDLLRLDPSVDVRQRGVNGVQADVSIRGGTFGQTLVLMNGLRMNDAQSGHHNMNIPVPMESVERIEVLKGSGSTLYGADAVGGVINIVTRPPEGTEFRLRASAGNFGVNQQRGSISGGTRRITQQLAFSRDFSTGFIPNRDFRNLSLSSATRWRGGEVTLAHNDRPFGAEQFYGNFNSWERTKGWWASIRQDLGPKTEAAFSFRRHTDLFVLFRDRPQVFTNRHATETYQGILRRREELRPTATFHYGGETLHESIVSNNLGTHSRMRGAGYAALDVRTLRRFSFTLGARHEVYRNLQGQFSPSVGAGYWIHPRAKLRAAVSRAFRMPTYTDLYYHDPANRGSPDLRPERAWNYEGGVDWSPGDWRLELTVFHRRERDGIDYVRRSPSDLWRATNLQRLRFTGVEAFARRRIRRHEIDLAYTGLRGAQDSIPGILSRYVFNYPTHSGFAGWQALLPGGILARSRLGAIQRFRRPAYAVWDLFFARSAGSIQPFLQFTNLTGSVYQEIPGVAVPGRGVVGGLQWVVFRSR